MTMKNDGKFEEEMTSQFIIDTKNVMNFDPSPHNLKNLHFDRLLNWPKYIMFELKKYRGVMFDNAEYWCKIWRKTTESCFQNWHKEFDKLHRLKNSNFILESKMAERNQNLWKLGCKNFILPWNKWVAQLTKFFKQVLQKRCS